MQSHYKGSGGGGSTKVDADSGEVGAVAAGSNKPDSGEYEASKKPIVAAASSSDFSQTSACFSFAIICSLVLQLQRLHTCMQSSANYQVVMYFCIRCISAHTSSTNTPRHCCRQLSSSRWRHYHCRCNGRTGCKARFRSSSGQQHWQWNITDHWLHHPHRPCAVSGNWTLDASTMFSVFCTCSRAYI